MRELLAHGADPLIPTSNGTTPLMMAAGTGHAPGITRSSEREALEAIHLCVELGADVTAVNESGDTALHGAAWRERADSIVQFSIIDAFISIDQRDPVGPDAGTLLEQTSQIKCHGFSSPDRAMRGNDLLHHGRIGEPYVAHYRQSALSHHLLNSVFSHGYSP